MSREIGEESYDDEEEEEEVEEEMKDEEEEGTSVSVGQHIQTLASWELDLNLGQEANKGPMLFAGEHLQERLKVKEGRCVR